MIPRRARAVELLTRLAASRPDAFALARLASLAAVVEAGLLRRLRLAFLKDADVGTEADLWFDPVVESRGTDRIVLDADVAALLQEDLATDKDLLGQAYAVLESAHRHWPESIRLEERLGFLALRGEADAGESIEAALRPALRALSDGGEGARAAAQWVLRALPRAHPDVRTSEAALALALAASVRLGHRRILKELPDGHVPLDRIAWALPPHALATKDPLGLELRDGEIRFVDPRDGLPVIALPRTNPRLLELSWSRADGRTAFIAEAETGRAVVLDRGVTSLTLTTLADDEYLLEEDRSAPYPPDSGMRKRLCFVIMGFGVKTDFATGRKIDLDRSYRNMIKPVVENAGLTCLRGDETWDDGNIESTWYDRLMTADVVIADLSTGHPETFYELGIRHGLRPHTTIIVSENKSPYPFSLNHSLISSYGHLGLDIDYDEVMRFRSMLGGVLNSALANPKTDSPVYALLPHITPPMLSPAGLIAPKLDRDIADAGRRTCFVIMGFGTKTDFVAGRKINLDRSYTNIIKPVAEEAGLVCLRADEISDDAGVGSSRYEQLMTADVVIADLSASVPETFYELGIRHALRPSTTLVISDKGLQDRIGLMLPHILSYDHLGDAIGFDEVMRFRDVLRKALVAALSEPTVDSPVYRSLAGGGPRGPAGPSSGGDTVPPFRLPPRPTTLRGREREIRKVCEMLEGDTRTIVIIGASDAEVFAVAVEAAYRSAGAFPGGCLYLENGGPRDVDEILSWQDNRRNELASQLALDIAFPDEQSLDKNDDDSSGGKKVLVVAGYKPARLESVSEIEIHVPTAPATLLVFTTEPLVIRDAAYVRL